MQGTRHNLLAHARRSADHYAAARGRNFFNGRPHCGNSRTAPDNLGLRTSAPAQVAVFPGQSGGLDSAPHNQQQTVALKRFFDEVIGAELNGMHRRFDIAMTGNIDDRHFAVLRPYFLQNFDAVKFAAAQPDIENNQ